MYCLIRPQHYASACRACSDEGAYKWLSGVLFGLALTLAAALYCTAMGLVLGGLKDE